MDVLRLLRRCVHVAWFCVGVAVAILISLVLHGKACDRGKERCQEQEEIVRIHTCHPNASSEEIILNPGAPPTSSSLPASVYWCIGVSLGLCLLFFIVGASLHFREARRSRSYHRLVKAALLHQTRCHASVPEKRQSWKPICWQANVFSCKDLSKICCLELDMVNIAGVGLTLYRATMVVFLCIAVLCRIGNGISPHFLPYLSQDWCLSPISSTRAADIFRDMAQERGFALLRLYIIFTFLHLYHLYRQNVRRDEFDRIHAEMSDYALLASGFPESASRQEILEYFQTSLASLKAEDIRWKPEIVGVSIGYGYKKHARLLKHLVEEHLIDVSARLEVSQSSESESSETSGESSQLSCSLPAPLSKQRSTALRLSGSENCEEQVLEVLRQLPNSGTVILVCRWPCQSPEIQARVQQCLSHQKFEGCRIKIDPMPCEPPSIIWQNFEARLFEPSKGLFWGWCPVNTLRGKQIFLANVLIVGAFALMLTLYYFLYKLVYHKGEQPEQILTKVVTSCCALGNVLLNQLVWLASQQVGYRVGTHCDTFVLRWYAVGVLTNMCFNFFVICLTAGSVPQEPIARIQYESRLASRLTGFLRGSLVFYAIWPLYYLFHWLKGFAQIMLLHFSQERKGLTGQRCKWLAEEAAEPPEWYMQYDYAGIVVLETTSFMCLFVFGFDSWKVFSWDVVFVCCMYFLNKYIYLGLSKETFYTSQTLDTSAAELVSLALGVLAGCVCHWGFRADQPVMFTLTTAALSLLYLWAFDRILQSKAQQSPVDERVWYDDLPYEELERMYSFNWFNTNPGHMMRILHGVDKVDQVDQESHQQVVWQHGRGYLQPDLCFGYRAGEGETDDEGEEPAAAVPGVESWLYDVSLEVSRGFYG